MTSEMTSTELLQMTSWRHGATDAIKMAQENQDDFYAGLTKSQICAIAHKNTTDSTILFEKKLKSRFSHALPVSALVVFVF